MAPIFSIGKNAAPLQPAKRAKSPMFMRVGTVGRVSDTGCTCQRPNVPVRIENTHETLANIGLARFGTIQTNPAEGEGGKAKSDN